MNTHTHSGGYCGCSGKNAITAIIIGQVVHFKYKLRNVFPVVKVFLDWNQSLQ